MTKKMEVLVTEALATAPAIGDKLALAVDLGMQMGRVFGAAAAQLHEEETKRLGLEHVVKGRHVDLAPMVEALTKDVQTRVREAAVLHANLRRAS